MKRFGPWAAIFLAAALFCFASCGGETKASEFSDMTGSTSEPERTAVDDFPADEPATLSSWLKALRAGDALQWPRYKVCPGGFFWAAGSTEDDQPAPIYYAGETNGFVSLRQVKENIEVETATGRHLLTNAYYTDERLKCPSSVSPFSRSVCPRLFFKIVDSGFSDSPSVSVSAESGRYLYITLISCNEILNIADVIQYDRETNTQRFLSGSQDISKRYAELLQAIRQAMQANPDAYVYDAYKCAFAPLPSPDGQKVIYQRSNAVGSIACSYYVYDVQSGESVLLFDRSYSGRYVASFDEEVILWLDNDTIRICPVVRPEGKIDILDLTVDFRFQNEEWQRFDLLRAEPGGMYEIASGIYALSASSTGATFRNMYTGERIFFENFDGLNWADWISAGENALQSRLWPYNFSNAPIYYNGDYTFAAILHENKLYLLDFTHAAIWCYTADELAGADRAFSGRLVEFIETNLAAVNITSTEDQSGEADGVCFIRFPEMVISG